MYWRRIRRLRLRPVCTVLINCRTTTSMYTALRNNWGSRLAQTRRCRLRLTICRRQEERGAHAGRDAWLARWAEQGRAPLALALPGCEFECLLPDAYYSACRNADTRIRTAVLRTAVRYLQDALA